MSQAARFIHLRLHTEYSLLEGAVPVKKLPALAAKHNMPAVAVTDTNNLFAALEFSVGAPLRVCLGCLCLGWGLDFFTACRNVCIC